MSVELWSEGRCIDGQDIAKLAGFMERRELFGAALAVMLRMSGATSTVPDEAHVREIARATASDDGILSVLGTAVFFAECNYQVRLSGPVDPTLDDRARAVWEETLFGKQRVVRDCQPPSPETITQYQESSGWPWTMALVTDVHVRVIRGGDTCDFALTEAGLAMRYPVPLGAAAIAGQFSLLAVRPQEYIVGGDN